MTNAQFITKLNVMFKEYLPIAGNKKTINELVFVLKHDDEIEDYILCINSKSLGFSFGSLKESFFPTRRLALKINAIQYEEDKDSQYPCITVDTN